MSVRNLFSDPVYLQRAKELADKYRSALPFPSIAIDDFLPEDVALDLFSKFPDLTTVGYASEKPSKGDVVRKKFGYRGVPPGFEQVFEAFSSEAFVKFLEALTGESNLLPDPDLGGAGISEVLPGGKLKIHVDYNLFKKHEKPLLRKVNLIYFLTPDWQESWGGHLELWDKDATSPAARILPKFNRVAIFESSDRSYHGHPHPLTCPENVRRRNMAFYYFVQPTGELPERHGTLYIDTP